VGTDEVEDVADEPINAGEESFEVEDAGSAPEPVKPPDGQRWIDVTVAMRYRVDGPADADMVAQEVHHALTEDPAYLTRMAGQGTQYESLIAPVEIVKISGVEQGLGG
jgi:hypothetical protein